MERHGSLRESLRLAGEVIREGYILLIFPEGTRSTTGVMADFKPSLGYLALAEQVRHPADVPRRHARGDAEGPLPAAGAASASRRTSGRSSPTPSSKRATEGVAQAERIARRHACVELAVRQLAPHGDVNRGPAAPSTPGKLTAESVMTPETES